MHRRLLVLALSLLLFVPSFVGAQAPAAPAAAQTAAPVAPAQPLASTLKSMWDTLRLNLVQSADKMPEADYGFKPTPDVMSYGQLLAHVAASSYSYCARGKGEDNPNKEDFQKTRTTKADIMKALTDATAYCDSVYGSMTDAAALELVKSGQALVPKARFLIINISHDNEHYGNLVTYLRMKGLVPPSTERAQQPRR